MIQRVAGIHGRHINQRNFKLVIGAAAAAAVIAFFIYEFKFLRAPDLEVIVPDRDTVADAGAFDIRGRTNDREADLTMNGRPLYSGETGEFAERVYLAKGLNRLDFEARNRYGKTTRVTRHVVAR